MEHTRGSRIDSNQVCDECRCRRTGTAQMTRSEQVLARLRLWIDPLVLQRHALRLIGRVLTYVILLEVTYVFLYPVLYMVSTSLKSASDIADITVYWVPTELYFDNFDLAFEALTYFHAMKNSLITSAPAAAGQVLVCAFVAYGFARISFPGRDLLFLMVLLTFVIPPQTILVPLFFLYLKLGWLNTYLPWIVPAWLGHGVKGALFVLIFRQYLRGLPWELEDAAFVDGASRLRVFWQIILPMATPAILVVLLFSMVWHWNDSFLPLMFLSDMEEMPLPARLVQVVSYFWRRTENYGLQYSEGLLMASTVLVVLPQLVLYIFVQRYFVESINRTGLVE